MAEDNSLPTWCGYAAFVGTSDSVVSAGGG